MKDALNPDRSGMTEQVGAASKGTPRSGDCSTRIRGGRKTCAGSRGKTRKYPVLGLSVQSDLPWVLRKKGTPPGRYADDREGSRQRAGSVALSRRLHSPGTLGQKSITARPEVSSGLPFSFSCVERLKGSQPKGISTPPLSGCNWRFYAQVSALRRHSHCRIRGRLWADSSLRPAMGWVLMQPSLGCPR